MNNELDIIARIRGEVMGHREVKGKNLFLIWGYPTAFFLLLEFAALMLWHKNWCTWLWMGIPLVGAPQMIHVLHKDYGLSHHRTLDSNTILQMWIFVGFISGVGGATMGFAGVFEMLYATFQGLLIGLGCFLTGLILRYRPKMVCGVIGSVVSFVAIFFQGDLWPWQLLIAAMVSVIALIIPGHLFNQYVKKHGI